MHPVESDSSLIDDAICFVCVALEGHDHPWMEFAIKIWRVVHIHHIRSCAAWLRIAKLHMVEGAENDRLGRYLDS